MKLFKAEFQRNFYTYIKNKKTTILSLIIFITIISITLNIYNHRFDEVGDIGALIIGTVYLIRLSLSSLIFPTSQVIEYLKKNNIDTTINNNYFNLETILLIRSIFALFFNTLMALSFVILLDIFNSDLLNESFKNYFMIFLIGFIGAIGIVGLGLVILSLVWKLSINMPVVLLSQILLILLIFSTPINSSFIPFSDTKIFIINIFNGYDPSIKLFLEYLVKILTNSVFYLLLGYYTLKFTRVKITSKKIKEWEE